MWDVVGTVSQPERSAVQVGGAFRMPKVQEILSEFFGEKKLRKTLNGEEAAALGASPPSCIGCGRAQIPSRDKCIIESTQLGKPLWMCSLCDAVMVPRGHLLRRLPRRLPVARLQPRGHHALPGGAHHHRSWGCAGPEPDRLHQALPGAVCGS